MHLAKCNTYILMRDQIEDHEEHCLTICVCMSKFVRACVCVRCTFMYAWEWHEIWMQTCTHSPPVYSSRSPWLSHQDLRATQVLTWLFPQTWCALIHKHAHQMAKCRSRFRQAHGGPFDTKLLGLLSPTLCDMWLCISLNQGRHPAV